MTETSVPKPARQPRQFRSSRSLFGQLAGLGAALAALLAMMWPAFRIKFGIIDDHEILDIIGRHDRLPLLEIPSTVWSRSNEPYARFRPVYWLGRALEAATAGQNPALWYVDRFVLAAIALTAIYLTAVRFMSPVAASLVSLLAFVGPQFEAWSRLGPAESYAQALACVGLALVVRGVLKQARPAQLWLGYSLLSLAALAKENFLMVSTVILAWTALRYGIRKLARRDWWVLGAMAVLATLDLAVIAAKSKEHGSVYAQQRTLSTLASWSHFAFDAVNQATYVAAGLLLGLVIFAFADWRPTARKTLAYVGLVGLLGALQLVFYAGAPEVGRYLYPLALVPVFVWGFVGLLCWSARSRSARATMTGLLALTLLLPISAGIRDNRATGETSATATAAFTTALANIEAQAISSGADAVVLQPVNPPTDVERVLSLARFISVQTDLKVMTLPATNPGTGFDRQLSALIETWSAHGDGGRLEPYVPSLRCLSIVFGDNRPVCAVSAPPPA